MSRISAFMTTHNCINKGDPFVESILQLNRFVDDIVVADLWSNDGTDEIIRQLPCKFMFTTLDNPYRLFQTRCKNELVLMVDSNEVIDTNLLRELVEFVETDKMIKNVSLPRIEVSYNFQKIAWSVHEVHRVFPKNVKSWRRKGATTNKTHLKRMIKFGKEYGYLWSCANNFRDNWYQIAKHKDLVYLPANHYMSQISIDRHDMIECCKDDLWRCTRTPFKLPDILVNLVGDKKYNPKKNLKRQL